jgi:hypothetical protein
MAVDDEPKAEKPSETAGRSARERDKPEKNERMPLGEILRRGLSAGRDVSESLFPRELASSLASQLIDARHGLVSALASEFGRFLRQADTASELRKALAGLKIEAKIQLRFSEDDGGKLKTDVEVETGTAAGRKDPT